jgi:mono/diheme cytochrome c family protein
MASNPWLVLSARLFTGMLVGTFACARNTATTRTDAAGVRSYEVVDAGRAIFHGQGECFACHGGKLQGGPVAPRLRGPTWEDIDGSFESIIQIVRGGSPHTAMVSRPGGITDAQALQVANYVWAVGHGKVDAAQEASLPPQDVITEGRGIFHGRGNCFACHGSKLQGGPLAPSLRGPTWQEIDGKFESIVHVLRGGLPHTPMVARQGGITDAEALQVANYVWAVSQGKTEP